MPDTDIREVIQRSVATLADDGGDDSTDTTVTDPPAEPVVADPVADPADPPQPVVVDPAVDEKAAEEAELKALEAELVSKTPGLRKGKLDVARHQAVLTRQRNKMVADHEKALAEAKAPFARYEAKDFQERVKIAELAETNPDGLFTYVLNHPNYAPVVERLIAERLAKIAPPVPEKGDPFADVPDEMPQPDDVRADGSLGYTAEGHRKLARWEAAQLVKPLRAELKAAQGQFKPLMDEREARAAFEQSTKTMSARLEEARTNASGLWPGFKDHEPAIAEFIHAPGNERVTLEQAYRVVLHREMTKAIETAKGDDAKRRLEIEAEIVKRRNGAAKETPNRAPVTAPPAETVVDPDSDPTTDLIRAAVRRANFAS